MKKRLITILSLALALMVACSGLAMAATTKSAFSGVKHSKYTVPSGKVIAHGVDVSIYQSRSTTKLSQAERDATSNVRWATLKNNGVDFAIIRIGGRWATTKPLKDPYYDDVTFADHYKKAKKEGLMTGVYFFSQALNATEGKAEAKETLRLLRANNIQPKDLELPVYIDYEYYERLNSSIKQSKATAAVQAFCETIEAAGYRAGVYASESVFEKFGSDGKPSGDNKIKYSAIKDYDIWVAQYYSLCEYSHDYSTWQYSSNGKMSSMFIDSNNKVTDCNFLYLDTKRTSEDEADIASCTLINEAYVEYNGDGKRYKAKLAVLNSEGERLTEDVDYVTGYLKNTKAGSGYIYIRGLGKYKGTKSVKFEIADDALNMYDLSNCHDAVEIREESELKLSVSDSAIHRIEIGTTGEDIAGEFKFKSGYSGELVRADGTPCSGALATGCKLLVRREGVIVGAAEIVVAGDLNGDGEQTTEDIKSVAECVAGLGTLKSSLASDVNLDGSVDIEDLVDIERTALNITDKDSEEADTSETLTLSKNNVYRQGYITLTAESSENTAGTPGAIVADLGLDGAFECKGVTGGNAVYNKGKLIMYATDDSGLSCTLKLRATQGGEKQITLNGEGRTLGKKGYAVAESEDASIVAVSGTTLMKLERKSKAFKASWNKQSDISGYQIRYSKSSSMSGAKTKSIGSKSTSATISKLSKGKKYYVQVRCYLKADGATCYSDWSAKKSVKTK